MPVLPLTAGANTDVLIKASMLRAPELRLGLPVSTTRGP